MSDDEALVEALDAAAQDWRELSYPDEAEMLANAARRIRELSAEVESLSKQLREQALTELAQMGQEFDNHE